MSINTMSFFNITLMIFIGIVSSIHLPQGLISHPETGLFFQYVGQLAPNERVMNLSMAIPITISGCYLIPLDIAKSMAPCSNLFHLPQSTDHQNRFKRDPLGWILGGSALVIGTVNSIAIGELRSQITDYANKLQDLQSKVELNGATLITVRDGVISIGKELKATQNLLTDQSKAIAQLEHNDAALNESIAYLAREQQQLHLRQENSLLYQSLIEMYEDRPSLLFMAPSDMSYVIAKVFEEAQLNYTTLYGHLPTIEAIRMLLVFQSLTFHASTTYKATEPDEIGRFIITNYFALPQPNVYFNVFRLTTIPFFNNGEFIKLTHIPMYIAQHINNSNTIEWTSDEINLCHFSTITICKDIPSIGNGVMNSRCIEQILNNYNLTTCRYEAVPSAHSFRVKLMQSWWAISSESNITCLKQPIIPTVLASEQQSVLNTHVMLPAVSLVHVERGTVLSCDEFQLIGKSAINTESIMILLNNTLANQVETVFDVQKEIKDAKAGHQLLPILSSNNVDKIITMLEETKNKSFFNVIRTSLKYSQWTYFIVLIVINLVVVVVVWCLCKGWITCPLITRLAIRKIPVTNMQPSHKEQDIDLHEYYQDQLRRKQMELSNYDD